MEVGDATWSTDVINLVYVFVTRATNTLAST